MEEYVDEAAKISNDEEIKEVYDMEYEYTNVGFERGMLKGTEKGLEQGQLQKQQEIAKNMLNEKIDENLISKVTNLTLEEINSLKEDSN